MPCPGRGRPWAGADRKRPRSLCQCQRPAGALGEEWRGGTGSLCAGKGTETIYKSGISTESIQILRSWGTVSWRCCGRPAQASPFAAVRGVSEGLEHRLENAVREQHRPAAAAGRLTTVRYPRARMRRLAMDAALGYTANTPALPPYLHLLGAPQGSAAPARRYGAAGVPLAGAAGAGKRDLRPNGGGQSRASDLGALCRAKPEPMGGYIVKKLSF